MTELDKWNKEIERLSFFAENATNKKIFKYYRQALIDIKREMKIFMDNYETLSFSKRLEAERLLENGKQIDKILRDINGKVNNTVEKYVKGSAERGYYTSWYAMEGANNINLNMNMLPEKYINELVNRPVKGKVFSKRLYSHTNKLAKHTTAALLDAARTGKSYAVAAKRISDLTEADYKKALRIARTEGGRVQSITKQRSYVEAKKKGVDLQKQWLSTLDKKTRHSHQTLDGQVVEIEEQFESEDGYLADGPRLFGVAKEDIHCRCTTITVVNGISPELRRDNDEDERETFPFKNYDEWYNDKKGIVNQEDKFQTATDRINWLTDTMEKMEDGDYGELTDDEAEELYDKYDKEIEELKKYREGLDVDDYKVLNRAEIDEFFKDELEHKKWRASLSDYDKEVISDYTSSYYQSFNQIKRTNPNDFFNDPRLKGTPEKWRKEMIKKSDELVEILDRYTTDKSFTTFRGFSGTVNVTKRDIGKKDIFDDGFMSSSLDKDVVKGFTEGENNVTFEIRVKKGLSVGAYVAENSRFANEREFLFKPKTEFKIIDVESTLNNNRKTQHITLEVLG